MRVAPIYGSGAAMGFTPQQINEMSIWQFYAALNGYIDHNTPKDTGKLSQDELEDLADWIYEGIDMSQHLKTKVYLWDEFGPVLDGEVTFTVQ
jgi:hypothetical protein